MTGGYLQFFQEDWIFILGQKYCFRRVSLRLQIKERKLFTLLLNIQILHSVQEVSRCCPWLFSHWINVEQKESTSQERIGLWGTRRGRRVHDEGAFWTESQGAHDVYRLRSFCRPFCSMVGRLKEGANSIATRPAMCYRFGRRSVLVVKNIRGFQIPHSVCTDDQESLIDNGLSWRIDVRQICALLKVLLIANQTRRVSSQ